METMVDQLRTHPFLSGMTGPRIQLLSHVAKPVVLHGGTRLFREGEPAQRFWLVLDGRIAVNFPVPGRGDVVIEQIGTGGVLGWSWLFPPYRWHFGATAAELTRAVQFDAVGVRRLGDHDPAFGLDLTTRFASVLAERLQATRVRLLDLYAYPGAPAPV